jgi:uncharacterized protein (DUF433 family)
VGEPDRELCRGDEFLEDYPKLTKEDILSALAYAADREHKTLTAKLSA